MIDPMRCGALLLAVLTGCAAAAPTPVARRPPAAAADEQPEYGEYGEYGDEGEGRELTPEEELAELRAAIEKQARPCASPAVDAGRFGEVRVVLRPGASQPLVEIVPDVGVASEDFACVEKTVRGLVGGSRASRWDLKRQIDIYIVVGRPPPLFPPMKELRPRWEAALRAPAARRRFEAKLPTEVTLTREGCLSIPARRRFSEGLERWLAGFATPLAQFWQEERASPGAEHQALLVGIGPPGSQAWRAYWLGDALLFTGQVGFGPPHGEVCLEALEERLARDLRARADRRATCWEGDLGDILTHPRTRFPAERLFASLAVRPERVCALDAAGHPVCCGERLPEDPPAGPFTRLALGIDFDCGLTPAGDLRCWGRDAPAGGELIPGPFADVGVGRGREQRMCAERRDAHALACWSEKDGMVPLLLPGGLPALAGFARNTEGCALDRSGRIACRSGGNSGFAGIYRALDGTEGRLCAINLDGRVECNRTWPSGQTVGP
jgi:hypothetical protein